MISICIIIGTVLLIIGIIIIEKTKSKSVTRSNTHSRRSPSTPPPLPQRRRNSQAIIGNTRPQHRRRIASGSPLQLPTRHSLVFAADGPRGLSPYKFPCCPIDRQRNVEGKPQRIFWDNATQHYRCSNNHTFKINGRL